MYSVKNSSICNYIKLADTETHTYTYVQCFTLEGCLYSMALSTLQCNSLHRAYRVKMVIIIQLPEPAEGLQYSRQYKKQIKQKAKDIWQNWTAYSDKMMVKCCSKCVINNFHVHTGVACNVTKGHKMAKSRV